MMKKQIPKTITIRINGEDREMLNAAYLNQDPNVDLCFRECREGQVYVKYGVTKDCDYCYGKDDD